MSPNVSTPTPHFPKHCPPDLELTHVEENRPYPGSVAGFIQCGVGIETLRDIGVRTQAAFQVIPTDIAQQRVARIAFGAVGIAQQLGGELVHRHHRVQLRAEEKRQGQALTAHRWRDHTVHGGAQVTVAGQFQ